MNIRICTALLLLAAAICTSPASAEGNEEQGREIGFTCLGCHGIEGQRSAYPSFRVPRLGGQRRDYIKNALRAYREGTRPHPTMHAQAGSLNDDDIENLLAWLDTAEPVRDVATAEQVAGLPAATICVTCHGVDGEGVAPQPPVLAGQHADYLEHALKQYREGSRSGNVMLAFAATLTDADIQAIAKYYSSQDGLKTLGK